MNRSGGRRRIALSVAFLGAAAVRSALAMTVIISGSGGDTVEGSGKVVEQARSASGYSRVIVRGPMTVQLRNTGSEKITVRADDNIVPLIETFVEAGKLVVGVKKNTSFRTRSPLSVVVEFKQLEALELLSSGDVTADAVTATIFEGTIQGSGDLKVDKLEAETVAVSISGSGNFGARGRAGTVGVVIKGSGDVRVEDLEAKSVAVRINGSGDARVFATDSLQASISGSGDVRYRGSPQVDKKIRGSGEVRPLR